MKPWLLLAQSSSCSPSFAALARRVETWPSREEGLVEGALDWKDPDDVSDRDDFLAWVKTTLYDAELALHHGDAAARRVLWSRNDPVSVLGAWRNAHGQRQLDELFASLARSFSDCTSYEFELQAYDVVGEMAYTAGLEHISASVDGQPRSYTLRATQVYRREGGEWKVVHRHGDTVTE
jgi:ketosteroid isomerase-like protein